MDLISAVTGCILEDVKEFIPKPGGSNFNVAVAISRLNGKSAILGRVGVDHDGRLIEKTLAKNSVNTRGLIFDPINPTTRVRVAQPDKTIFQYQFERERGADLYLSMEDVDTELVQASRIVHFCSTMLTRGSSREAQFYAAEIARSSGSLVSFDVNHRPGLWKDNTKSLPYILQMISRTDILKVNQNELDLITGSSKWDPTNHEIFDAGVKLLAITLGKDGSIYAIPGSWGHVPAFSLEALYPLGCGDAFMGALLSKISRTEGPSSI